MKDININIKVNKTKIDEEVFEKFDYQFDGTSNFTHNFHFRTPQDFNIGVIYGSSGSGKSTLLKSFGEQKKIDWDYTKSVLSHFKSSDEAINKLSAVGFNSIPSWGKPRNVLSTGEGFRVDMARQLEDNTVIDEFTSVVNRETAKSCSLSLNKYIRKNKIKNFVLATCHDDILEWLQPDWIYNTDLAKMERRSLRQRPEVLVELLPCSYEVWSLFSKHHYLTSNLNKASRCWLGIWNDKPVGFVSAISFPQPMLKEKCWREHRIVVLPDYQGIGIGSRISEAIGENFKKENCRYYTKTVHPQIGSYRNLSLKWRGTTFNGQTRNYNSKSSKSIKRKNLGFLENLRVSYCHEYIG